MQRAAPILVAILAATLIALAWPRLHAAWLFLPVENAIQDYWIDGSLSAEQLSDLQNRTRAAIDVHAHARFWNALSLLHYLEGLQADVSLNRQRQSFEAAIAAANESLRLAPIQPRLWMRKAEALNWLAFRADPALSAFKLSVYTGRVEPMLSLARLRLGYDRLGSLDEEGRELLRDQTLLAWHMRQREVLVALERGQLPFSRVRYLLESTHPDLLAEIELALAPLQ